MAYYTLNNYVICSIALLQLTKRFLKTTTIVLKIRERILQRICFAFLQFESFLKGIGANASNAFLLNTALPRFSGYFWQLNTLR